MSRSLVEDIAHPSIIGDGSMECVFLLEEAIDGGLQARRRLWFPGKNCKRSLFRSNPNRKVRKYPYDIGIKNKSS